MSEQTEVVELPVEKLYITSQDGARMYQMNVGPNPHRMTCPSCSTNMTTVTDTVVMFKGYLWSMVMCVIFFPLFWVPLCMDKLKQVSHSCPNCNTHLGTYIPY